MRLRQRVGDWLQSAGRIIGGAQLGPPQRKSNGEALARLVAGIDGGSLSLAGTHVTEDTALRVATVMACVSLLASDVATMPLQVMRESAAGNEPERDAPEFDMLMRRPNPVHTAFEFRQMMQSQVELRGNGLAFKVLDGAGRVRELWPLRAEEVAVTRRGYDLEYTVAAYDGRISGLFPRSRFLHLRQMTVDGIEGKDRLSSARDVIGLAAAAAATQSRAFANGGRMPGYWTLPGVLDPESMAEIERKLIAASTGENAYRSPIVDLGIKYETTGQNFADAEMVETRKHQITEVCAAFGVLPAVLGIDDKTQAFASVEAMMRWHLEHTLRPRLVMWEQALDRDVLDGPAGPLRARFDTRGMEKASTAERAQSYRSLVELGIMTRNEARALEGLPRIDGLDEPLTPANMGTGGADAAT